MTDRAPRDVEWPTRRWVLWVVSAVVVLIAIILFFVWLGSEETPGTPEGVNQVEWAIVLTDQNGDTVTLKGDRPLGIPTETWDDNNLVARSATDTFGWDMNRELPTAVVEIDDASDCAALNTLLDNHLADVEAARGDAFNWQARAFTQHTIDTMRSGNCPIDESDLSGL